jgi:hypothetical protein
MSDLHDQLIAQFGASVKPDLPDSVRQSDPLEADAHLQSSWLRALLPAARSAGLKVPDRPSLEAAKQLHDRLSKHLKTSGRGRERKDLIDERSRYLKKREKVVWARLKSILEESGVSDRFYRSLKQGKVDPERVLRRVVRLQPQLSEMNNAQIKAALSGQ